MNSCGNILSLIDSSSSTYIVSSTFKPQHLFYISLTVFSNYNRSGNSHSSYGRTLAIHFLIKGSDIVKLTNIKTLLSTFSSNGRFAQPGGASNIFSGFGSPSASAFAICYDFSFASSLHISVQAYIPSLINLGEIIFLFQIIRADLISLTLDIDSRELKYYKVNIEWLPLVFFRKTLNCRVS